MSFIKLPNNLLYYTGIGVILSVVSLLLDGIQVFPYLGVAAFTMYLHKRMDDKRESQVDAFERISWLFTELSDIDPHLQYDIKTVDQLSPRTASRIKGSKAAEIGIHQFKLDKQRVLPDITATEVELEKLEERASIIMGAIVFLPIMFALLHVFRSVGLGVFLVEIYITLSLGILVLRSQKQKYSLEKWLEIFEFLETHQDGLSVNPRQLLSGHELTRARYRKQELGLNPSTEDELPAMEFLHMVVSLIIELDADLRSQYLRKILEAVHGLPTKERMMEQRWAAYRMRVILISISATALGALFASLAVFSVPLLGSPGFEIGSTPYLSWGEFVVVMVLNGYVLSQWYSEWETARWLGIFGIIYLFFYWINSVIV